MFQMFNKNSNELHEILNKVIDKKSSITQEDLEKLKSYFDTPENLKRENIQILYNIKNEFNKKYRDIKVSLFRKVNDPNKDLKENFKALFIQIICRFLLEDEKSPGEIDEDEAKWLRSMMSSDGKIDKYEEQLIKYLKLRSISFPQILVIQNKFTKKLDWIFQKCSYVSIVAVVCSIALSFVQFTNGAITSYSTIKLFCTAQKDNDYTLENGDYLLDNLEETAHTQHEKEFNNLAKWEKSKVVNLAVMINLVSILDYFLFAMVLLIFGIGVFKLFLIKNDIVEFKYSSTPSWLKISSIDDLKSTLGKLILMLLIVNIFKFSLQIKYSDSKDILYLAVAVVLISASLYIAHKNPASHIGIGKEENATIK